MFKHRPLLGLLASAALVGSFALAWAVQPGTTGTEKRFQREALRSAVLTQPNTTGTAVGGAVTIAPAGSGIITTESLNTAAQGIYTLTVTNPLIAAADIVFASVQYGDATTGSPYIDRVTPAAGSVAIRVRNGQSGDTVLNGTLKISFLVIKQSPNGAD